MAGHAPLLRQLGPEVLEVTDPLPALQDEAAAAAVTLDRETVFK